MKRKLFWAGLAVVLIAILVVCILCIPQKEQHAAYAIKVADSVTNGQITVSVSSAEEGTTVTLEVTPDEGYILKEGTLKANDTPVEGNSFVMPNQDVTITAEFEKIQYSVTIGDMENGEVTASRRTAGKGDKVVVTVIPDAGYQLKEGTLKVNGVVITDNAFEMPGEAVVITAEFEVATYTITVVNEEDGTITVDKQTARYGEMITVTPTPGANREYVGVLVNGTEVKGLTFEMPAANVTVTGIFRFSGDVLGDLAADGLERTRSEGFDISNDSGSDSYVFTTAGDQQWVFFKNTTGTDLLVRATISAKEIYNNDEFPRFGVALYNGSNTVYFNVEATGLNNNEDAMVVTGQLGTDNWAWGSMLQVGNGTGDYSGDDGEIEMMIVKNGDTLFFFLNGQMVGCCQNVDGMGADDVVAGALLTMNMNATFTDYEVSTSSTRIKALTGMSIKLDADLSDWNSGLSSVGVVGSDAYAGKGVTFWSKLTDEGLYLGAVAKHGTYIDTADNWWENTNFEFFINGTNQYWYSAMGGGATSNNLLAAAKTTGGKNGKLYTTTVEAFIPMDLIPAEWITDGSIRVGFAWKTIGDICNNGDNGENEYWLVPGHQANVAASQFVVDSTGIHEFVLPSENLGAVSGSINKGVSAGVDLTNDNGKSPSTVTTDGDQQWAFFKDQIVGDFVATTKVTAQQIYNDDAYPRFGLMVYTGSETIYFNVEASSLAANKPAMIVTGALNTGDWDWGNMYQLSGATGKYTGSNSVELTVARKGSTLYFYINGSLAGVKSGYVAENEKVAVGVLTFNIGAKFFDYSISTDAAAINQQIGASITLDGDLSDWNNGLTSVGVVGSDAYAGKGVTFWSKLTDDGLYVGAVANHSVYTNTSGNWWENTNFEFFINGTNQYWYSAMGGGTSSNGLAAVAKTTGGQNGALYTTVVEGYIPIDLIPAEWITDGSVRVGFAWKTPGDICNNGDNGENEYWLVPGHQANVAASQFVVDATGIHKFVLPAENLGAVSGSINKGVSAGVDLTNDNGSDAYTLTTSGDQQWAFFKDQIVGDFVITTKVTAQQIFNDDAYPRFGLMVYTGSQTIYFNVEAGNLEANKPAMIVTGTLNTGDWNWGDMYQLSSATGSYTGSDSVELTIARKGSALYFYINSSLVGIKSGYVAENEQVAVGILTFNIGGKFFDYSISTDASVIDKQISAPITLDGDLSDWNSGLTSAGVVGSGEYEGKGVTFWSKLTDKGLYLGAVANHSVYTDTAGSWWLNTNFEFFINGGNQYWYSAMNGGTTSNGLAAVARTTGGQDGALYTTTVEAYIPIDLIPAEWITNGIIRVGFAWKTPGDNCNNGNDGTSEYWLAPGHPANNLEAQFAVDSTGIYKYILPAENLGSVSGSIEKSYTAGVDLTNDNGSAPYAVTTSGDQQWVFFKDQIVGDFVATTKVTAEQVFNNDGCPRFGLMVYTGSKTVYFNVEAAGLEANKPAMIVVGGLGTGDWEWGSMYQLSSATGSYTGSDSVELTIARKGSTLYFYINGSLVGVKSGYVSEDEQVAVGILTMNIGGKFFDYSLSTDSQTVNSQIGASIILDGDLSDWNSGLTSAGVVGTGEYEGKGVTFWSKLTSEGLYLGAVANHSVYTNTSGNWWENTNFEFFLNGGNQYWYSAMNGGTTSNGLAAVAKTTGGENGALYTTTVEAFIPIDLIPTEWITDGSIRVGFAWKTPGDNCNNGNDGTSEYWLVPGRPANNLDAQFVVTDTGLED